MWARSPPTTVVAVSWALVVVVSLVAVPGVALDPTPPPAAAGQPDPAVPSLGPPPPDTRAPAADVLPPEAFGYGAREASGVRPVLIVLVEYDDQRLRSNHTPSVYADRLANVSEYFTENSGGQFTWGTATVVGPATVVDDPDTDWDEGRHDCWWNESTADDACDDRPDRRERENRLTNLAVERALDEVDASTYDRDGDGRLDQDELAVVVFQARPSPADGGMVRWSCATGRLSDGGVDVCLDVAVLGEGAGFATIAHELAHQLGADDIYGAGTRMNQGLSLMGPTIFKVEDDDRTFHLDPWHKIQFGWTTPQVYAVDELQRAGQCHFFAGPDSAGPLSERYPQRPVLLYDPARYDPAIRAGEYYLLEYRDGVSFDRDVAAQGLVVWYVRTAGGDLVYQDAVIHPRGESDPANDTLVSQATGDDVRQGDQIRPGPNGVIDTTVPTDADGKPMDGTATDAMNFVVAPAALANDAPRNYSQRGRPGAWSDTDDAFELRWFDGEPVGLALEVTDDFPRLAVDLNADDIRLETVPGVMAPDGAILLTGHVGERFSRTSREHRQVRLAGGGVSEVMRTTLWRCDRIRAAGFGELPTGTYRLWVEDPETGVSSDVYDLEVRSRVEHDAWLGTYEGRLDGRPARLSVTLDTEFTLDIELHDPAADETYRTTVDRTDRHVLGDLTLRSAAGSTVELDSLTLHRDDTTWLTGTADRGGDHRGVAFAGGGDFAAYDGDTLLLGEDDPWVEQWTGTYDGRLDGREATLRIEDPVSVTFGTLRPGEGYRFDVEIEDHEAAVTYRGTGLVDTTTPGAEHELELTRLEPVGAATDAAALRDVVLSLHTRDTGVVSGTARVGRHVPGDYGPTDEAVAMQFMEPGPPTIDPALVGAIRGLDAGEYPAFAGTVLGNERVNLELGDAAIGITTDGRGEPTRIRRTPHDSPTLIVSVDEPTMDAIATAPEPAAAVREAALAGDIDYRATTVTGQFKVGLVKTGVAVYRAGRWLGSRLPFP